MKGIAMKKLLLVTALCFVSSSAFAADLSLSVGCNPCEAGKTFRVKGKLTDGGSPLSRRPVTLVGFGVDETKKTNSTGNVEFQLKAPAGTYGFCGLAEGAAESILVAVE
jgi:hypothetical protein